MEQNLGTIKVERETFEKNGKSYFSYFVKGNIRGVDVKILMTPPDLGGYTVLDIVFAGEKEADFIATPFEFKDAGGNAIKGFSYMVRSYDEDGTAYECKVKPSRASDKSLLNMLVRNI